MSTYDVVKETVGELGDIDILVNSAGVSKFTLIQDCDKEAWDNIIDTNIKDVAKLIAVEDCVLYGF